MKVYYAHSMSIYSTPQEERDVKTLSEMGFEILNPNHPDHEKGYNVIRAKSVTGNGMSYFTKLLKSCDALAFRAHPDGSISAGVMKEITAAKRSGMPVVELPSGVLKRALTVTQTVEYLKEIGER